MHQISQIYMSGPLLLIDEVPQWQEHRCIAVPHLLVKKPNVIRYKEDTFDDGAGLSEASALLIEGNVNCTSTPNLTWPIAQDT